MGLRTSNAIRITRHQICATLIDGVWIQSSEQFQWEISFREGIVACAVGGCGDGVPFFAGGIGAIKGRCWWGD